MNTTIHKANTVDFEKFEYGDPTVNKYGGKSCRIKYDGADFYLQLPRMRLPYGMSVYEVKDPDGRVVNSKYSLDFSLGGYEKNDKGVPHNQRIYDFFNFLEKAQTKLHEQASKNSSEWLGIDDATIEVARALCREEIRYSKDKVTKKPTNKYPPTFKAKVTQWEGRFLCNAFDENKEPITDLLENCPGGTEAVAIVKLQQVTFAGGKCGYNWLVHQIKLFPPTRMPSYAFMEDDEDNAPVREPVVEDENGSNNVTEPVVTQLDDSDDDSDDDDELDHDDEEEEEVAPPPKKKVVKRKTKTHK